MCMTYVISTGRMNVFLYSDVMCSGIQKNFSLKRRRKFSNQSRNGNGKEKIFKDFHRNWFSRNQAFDLLDTRWMSRNVALWNEAVVCCETWNTSQSWVKCLMTKLCKFEFDLVEGSFQCRVLKKDKIGNVQLGGLYGEKPKIAKIGKDTQKSRHHLKKREIQKSALVFRVQDTPSFPNTSHLRPQAKTSIFNWIICNIFFVPKHCHHNFRYFRSSCREHLSSPASPTIWTFSKCMS